MTSQSLMPKTSVNSPMKSMTERWDTAIPFGVPVEPDVNIT